MKHFAFILGFAFPFLLLGCANMYAVHEKPTINCGSIEVGGMEIKRYALPVKYYLDKSVPDKIGVLVKNALENINKQSGMELLVLVDRPGNWAEPVKWVGSDWPFLPHQIAVTQVWSINGILTHAPVNLNAPQLVEMEDSLIQITIEHEFGHALGLPHETINMMDLMWHAAGNDAPDYTQSVSTLKCLYK